MVNRHINSQDEANQLNGHLEESTDAAAEALRAARRMAHISYKRALIEFYGTWPHKRRPPQNPKFSRGFLQVVAFEEEEAAVRRRHRYK